MSALAQRRPLPRLQLLLFFWLNVDYFSNLQIFIRCAELKRTLFFFCQPKCKGFFSPPANKTSKMPRGGKRSEQAVFPPPR